MKKLILPLSVLITTLYSCGLTNTITVKGTVTERHEDTVTVNGKMFKCFGNIPNVGEKVKFRSIKNLNKINAQQIKNNH